MAENESIGGIAVDIVGDYSKLQSDIDSAAQVAQEGGQQIAGAFNDGAQAADTLTLAVAAAGAGLDTFDSQIEALVESGSTLAEALAAVQSNTEGVATGVEAAGESAAQAATQLDLFDAALEVPYADAAGQLNLFATELEPIAAHAEEAAAGLGTLNEETQQYGSAAQAVIAKQQELDDKMFAAAGAVEELKKAYADGAIEAVVLERAEQELADATDRANASTREASEGAHHFLESMLELAGIELTLEALKEFVKEAIEVYAATERAQIAIGFLTGDAKLAAEAIETLKSTAMELALPFDSLVGAEQKMVAFGLSTEAAEKAIRAAADAAAATGNTFDQVANSIERMVLSGMASNRQLVQIGLDTKELAAAMSVSAGRVKEAFSAIDETTRASVIELANALATHEGAAKAVAESTSGALQKMATAWHLALDEVGAALAPIVMGIAHFATDAAFYFQLGTVEITLWATTVIDSFKAVGYAAHGDIASAIQMVKEIGEAQQQAVVKEAELIVAHEKGTAAIKENTAATAEEIAAKVKAALAAADAAKAMKEEAKEAEAFAKSAATLFNAIPDSYEQYLDTLTQGGKTAQAMLNQVQADINKANTMMESMSGAPLAGMKAWVASLTEARDTVKAFAAEDVWSKTAVAIQELTAKYSPALAGLDQATLDWVNSANTAARDVPAALNKISDQSLLGTLLADITKVQNETVKMTSMFEKSFGKYEEAAKSQAIPITETLHERLMDVDTTLQDIAQWQPIAFAPSAISQYMDMVHQLNAEGMKTVQQYESQIKDAQILLDKMNAMHQPLAMVAQQQEIILADQIKQAQATGDWQRVEELTLQTIRTQITAAAALGEPLGARLDLAAKFYKQEIENASLVGRDATEEVVALGHVQMAKQALIDQSQEWGKVELGVEQDIIKGLESLGQPISKVIVEGGSLADAFVKVGQQIAETCLTTIIDGGIKLIISSIITNLIPTIASTVPTVTTVATSITGMQTAMHAATAAMTADIQTLNAQFASLAASINAVSGSGAAGGGSGVGGSAAGGLAGGPVGTIAGIVSAISSIIGNVQMARMSNLLGEIEVSTRTTMAEVMNVRPDLWSQHNGLMAKLDDLINIDANGFNNLFTRLGDLWTGLMTVGAGNGSGSGTAPANLPSLPSMPAIYGSGINATIPANPFTNPTASVGPSVYTNSPVSNGGTTIGSLSFTVQAAANPVQTARELANLMKTRVPGGAVFSSQ